MSFNLRALLLFTVPITYLVQPALSITQALQEFGPTPYRHFVRQTINRHQATACEYIHDAEHQEYNVRMALSDWGVLCNQNIALAIIAQCELRGFTFESGSEPGLDGWGVCQVRGDLFKKVDPKESVNPDKETDTSDKASPFECMFEALEYLQKDRPRPETCVSLSLSCLVSLAALGK